MVDKSWKDDAVRGSYKYPAIVLNGTTGFCASATTTDTLMKGFATSHTGEIQWKAAGAAPTCDATDGSFTGGTTLGN
jgi:hypothetical protein